MPTILRLTLTVPITLTMHSSNNTQPPLLPTISTQSPLRTMARLLTCLPCRLLHPILPPRKTLPNCTPSFLLIPCLPSSPTGCPSPPPVTRCLVVVFSVALASLAAKALRTPTALPLLTSELTLRSCLCERKCFSTHQTLYC